MSTGWNSESRYAPVRLIINLLGNEYWLELNAVVATIFVDYKPTGK